jgi:flagellum-specific peptidoglycan hydrolase FlgJ
MRNIARRIILVLGLHLAERLTGLSSKSQREPKETSMPENADPQVRLTEVARIAVALEAQTRCPAQLLIAQWAVESQWGAKPAGNANFFGIKKNDRAEKCCTVTTREVINGKSVVQNLEFADYDSLEDSCRDYAWLITHGAPYRTAWARYQSDRDLHALIAAVAGTYATDPGYAHLAVTIAGQTNVARAIATARQGIANA